MRHSSRQSVGNVSGRGVFEFFFALVSFVKM